VRPALENIFRIVFAGIISGAPQVRQMFSWPMRAIQPMTKFELNDQQCHVKFQRGKDGAGSEGSPLNHTG
jgi:hypothetical protein